MRLELTCDTVLLTTDFVQISQNFMLVSIICFYTLFSKFHIVFSCIEQLQLHVTNSVKFSFHFYCHRYFLIFLVMAS